MTTETYKPNPTKGGEHIEARRKEVVAHLQSAVNVAYYHIDQQLKLDIQRLHDEAGQKKSKMMKVLSDAEKNPAMTVVRKYWQKERDDVLHHLTETIMNS